MCEDASAQHCIGDYENINCPIKEGGLGGDTEEAKYPLGPSP